MGNKTCLDAGQARSLYRYPYCFRFCQMSRKVSDAPRKSAAGVAIKTPSIPKTCGRRSRKPRRQT